MKTGKAESIGPTGGGGFGPIGGGGFGPIGGGVRAQEILNEIAEKFADLSKLFDDLASTPLGGPVPVEKPPVTAIDFQPQIPFKGEDQQGYELCWIAVAASVKRHFDPTSQLRQCELARALLGIRGICCDPAGGVLKECDKPGRLEDALNHPTVDHLAAGTAAEPNPNGGGAMTFEEIQAQIDNRLPVCVYIEWRGGRIGHFCLISGYDESGGGKYLYVNDPLFGSGPQPYNRVVSNYNLDHGTWQFTYRLKV